jgi:hypothetical protein
MMERNTRDGGSGSLKEDSPFPVVTMEKEVQTRCNNV